MDLERRKLTAEHRMAGPGGDSQTCMAGRTQAMGVG